MANRGKILKTIADFSTERLVEFLDVNGLGGYANVIRIKKIDGATFLNLNEFQINRWKPLISINEVRQFWTFLTEVKNAPEKFHHKLENPPSADDNKEITSTLPITKSASLDKLNAFGTASPSHETSAPNVLNISREDLENLCKNEEVLNTLKSYLKRRDKAIGAHVDDENVYGNEVVTAESVPVPRHEPPPVPRGHKPTTKNAPPPEADDSEQIYEDPPEIPVEVVRKMGSSLLPGRPFKMTAKFKAALPPTPQTEDYLEPVNQTKSQPRQLSKIKMTAPGPNLEKLQVTSERKISIRDTPLPPPPNFESKSQRKITENKLEDIFNRKLNAKMREPEPMNQTKSLPRPPRQFPKLADAPDFEAVPTHNRTPVCYRYTDRKGSEMLLTEDLGDGSYLLRPSRKFYCTLSLRYQKKIYHIGITELDDGTLECESSSSNFHFDSLNQITVYFKENPLTLVDGDNLHTVCLRDVLPADRT